MQYLRAVDSIDSRRVDLEHLQHIQRLCRLAQAMDAARACVTAAGKEAPDKTKSAKREGGDMVTKKGRVKLDGQRVTMGT
jgi:hypothetical protein